MPILTSRRAPRLSLLIAGLLLLVFPALACNFSAAQHTPAPDSAEALRLTLQAMSLPSPSAGPVSLPPATETPAAAVLTDATLPAPPFSDTQPPPPATLAPQAAGPFATLTPNPDSPPHVGEVYTYSTRSGDTADSVAHRFNVRPDEITGLPAEAGYLAPGIPLLIPNKLGFTSLPYPLLPDSELVYSPSAVGFDSAAFIEQAGGYLSTYSEKVNGETLSGAQIIQRVANELSINPRLLLALLEYRSGWVYGQPANLDDQVYPIGFYVPNRSGLFEEIKILGTQLNVGYYGWRQGNTLHVVFQESAPLRISPDLNAGTAALLRLFGLFYKQQENWQIALYGRHSFPQLFQSMFGDPWARAASVEPLLPAGLAQPLLDLPFELDVRWKFTGGPHDAWNAGTPRGALDFAPPNTAGSACEVSADWVTAAAAGIVVRAADHALALDLDGDGREQTGWVLVHLHLGSSELTGTGTQVALGDRLGHPSCDGGEATARHLHISRKYNGEWLPAALPAGGSQTWTATFVLGGWQAQVSASNFVGSLVRGAETLPPNLYGGPGSYLSRSTSP